MVYVVIVLLVLFLLQVGFATVVAGIFKLIVGILKGIGSIFGIGRR